MVLKKLTIFPLMVRERSEGTSICRGFLETFNENKICVKWRQNQLFHVILDFFWKIHLFWKRDSEKRATYFYSAVCISALKEYRIETCEAILFNHSNIISVAKTWNVFHLPPEDVYKKFNNLLSVKSLCIPMSCFTISAQMSWYTWQTKSNHLQEYSTILVSRRLDEVLIAERLL